MSKRNRADSGRIKERLALLDALSKKRVRDRGKHDEIDRTVKELFEALEQAEIGVGIPVRSGRFEFDKKVEIAGVGPKFARGGGTKQVQTPNAEPETELLHLLALLLDRTIDHQFASSE